MANSKGALAPFFSMRRLSNGGQVKTFLRLRVAAKAAGAHFLCSLVVAIFAAILVFAVWYPFPYRELAGGRELFLLIITVDVVCGPLLTLVLFNPAKPRAELWRDLSLVVLIQLAALAYGLYTVWQARPLYLVLEIDRFKVIAAPDLLDASLKQLPAALQPHWMGSPLTVGIRDPKSVEEKNKVLFESIQGGADYGERPEFFVSYEGEAALKSLTRAKPLAKFLEKYPAQVPVIEALAKEKSADMAQWVYLPVVGRQDWVAILDSQGQIQGFLPGDGF
jgi:hypothetical protein